MLCCVCEEARFFGFSLLYFGGEERRLALGSFDSIPPLAFFCKSSCLLWLFERERERERHLKERVKIRYRRMNGVCKDGNGD